MEKIVIHSYGGYDKLKLEQAETPSPGENEVLVENRAVGVNYADVTVRWGLYESAKKYVGLPITPGFEFAGVIKALGKNVENIAVGQKVFGVTFFNGYSSRLCVPQHQVYPMPSSLTFEQAAGVPAVFLTAYYALFENFIFRKGSKVLVHSAAGGVGSSLVQMAKINKCQVTGVVGSSHKVETVKNLGADFVIDKSSVDLWSEVEKISPSGFDVILDANGVSTLKGSYNHLAPMGKLVCYGFHSMLPKKGGKINWIKLGIDYLRTIRFNPLDMTNENKSIITFNLSFLFSQEELLRRCMEQIGIWFEEGKLVAPPITTYALKDVAKAHRDLESGKTVGKLVLIP
ncbi:MAG: zinc-binding dehydrogenase [Deltaproteobacteria bacterium]|nr:MAG: zinc-binding dehydrogenase [Deltaproteobacteria bacterium]